MEILRLEVLKLVNRHDLTAEQIIERAKQFEAYLTEGDEKPKVTRKPKTTTAPTGEAV